MSQTPANPSFTTETADHAVIVHVLTKLADDQPLKAVIRSTDETAGPDSGVTRVVLDMAHVAILPSMGLGLIVQLQNHCKARKQQLVIAALRPQLRQVFAITRLDRAFQFADSVEAALK